MKKALYATTALVLTAGIAAADVTVSGNGRFGLVYIDSNSVDSETNVSYRLRFNIDASKETDSGVKFGGRIRLQYDMNAGFDDIFGAPNFGGDTVESGAGAAEVNAAKLYAEAMGFRVEVGNVETALDSMNTLYNAELGFIGTTLGSYAPFRYDAYSSGPFGEAQADRVGVFVSYTVGDLVARLSYIDYDQFADATSTTENEIGVSIDYSTGPFSVGFGYVSNATGVDNYDVYALLGEYALNDDINIGAQYIAEDGDTVDFSDDATFTVYGNYALANGFGVQGYLSGIDTDLVTENDVAIGLGASYDLGGATIAGTIQKGFFDTTYADLGVTFTF